MHSPFFKYSLFFIITAVLLACIPRFFYRLDEAGRDRHYDLFVFLSLSMPFMIPALLFQEWIILLLAPQFAFFYMLFHRATIPGRCTACGEKIHLLLNAGFARCPHCQTKVRLKTLRPFKKP